MSPRVAEKTLEEIRLRNDIVEVISGYLSLKPAGQNFKALCPFHNEKTPSFTISPAKQIFHCFGCHAGGNVFSFVMKIENITFMEAVKLLGKKAGVQVAVDLNESAENKEPFYEAMETACSFYHDFLLTDQRGTRALKYLSSRGFSPDIIKQFRLGVSPAVGRELLGVLKKKNFSLDVLQQVGLVRMNEGKKEPLVWFRNRLMFPIFDLNNRVIGFGARALGDEMPKYINTPDTPLFLKNRVLYGLNFSKKDIIEKKSVILVEGYSDFIRLFSSGITNCAASLGTAFTENHARLLKRYAPEVVLAYDADQAGTNASLRAFDIFLEHGLQVKMLPMPQQEDPDSFVKKNGAEAFNTMIAKAPMMLDFKRSLLMKEHNSSTESGKTVIAEQMLASIRKIDNAVSRDYYLKKLSEEIGSSVDALREQLHKVKTPFRKQNHVEEQTRPAQLMNPREKMLLRLLFAYPEKNREVFEQLKEYELSDMHCRRIYGIIEKVGKKKMKDMSQVFAVVDDPVEQSMLSEIMLNTVEIPAVDQAFHEVITSIKKYNLKKEMNDLLTEIKTREQKGQNTLDLLKKMQEMRKSIASLL